ncbi:MAG: glycine dehydrogenase (aminomethyl-transferring), partial [Brachybacterium sp.]
MTASPEHAHDSFVRRHVGTDPDTQRHMLEVLGYESLDEMLTAAVPHTILLDTEGQGGAGSAASIVPEGITEPAALAELRALADRNTVRRSLIGLGYHGTHTPAVIQRNVLENPAWYTAYTPYQPEISQGRLEALLTFQTMICDLTGMDVSNASTLDEATSAAEALMLARRTAKRNGNVFLVDADTLPATKAVLKGRADGLGIELREVDFATEGAPEGEYFGALIQYPGASGRVWDPRDVISEVKSTKAVAIVSADLLALTMLASPGTLGADVTVGTSQRFGIPLGFGGPHAGFVAVRKGLERQLPGRLVGVSVDAEGNPAYRLSLQTREQHIRREKATSAITTAQVLLAVMAAMYAVYHGPEGLTRIGRTVADRTAALADLLRRSGFELVRESFFDTLEVRATGVAADLSASLRDAGYLVHTGGDDIVHLSLDETITPADLEAISAAFAPHAPNPGQELQDADSGSGWDGLVREDPFLQHPVFSSFRSETAMMRYLRRLADRDFALDRGMIPLGSCTMKLNSATEMA